MPLNPTHKKTRFINLGLVVFAIIILIIATYFYYNSTKTRKGPSILLEFPSNGMVVSSSIVEIEGQVANVSRIFLNNKQIPVRDGNMIKEKLLLAPGENTFVLRAYDKFGEENKQIIKIIYKQK